VAQLEASAKGEKREESRLVMRADAELERARREADELRRRASDDHRVRLAAEAETAFLRKALMEARALNEDATARASRFDEAYRRLWRATHDPQYVESTSPAPPPTPNTAHGTLKAALALQQTIEGWAAFDGREMDLLVDAHELLPARSAAGSAAGGSQSPPSPRMSAARGFAERGSTSPSGVVTAEDGPTTRTPSLAGRQTQTEQAQHTQQTRRPSSSEGMRRPRGAANELWLRGERLWPESRRGLGRNVSPRDGGS